MDSDALTLVGTKMECCQSEENGVLIHPHIGEMDGISPLLASPNRDNSFVSPDSFRAPHSPVVNRSSKFGATGSGRSPIPPGLKGPPGVPPPSSLYTAVISPKEMAQHEATNFKNVKGVYKNCRGIWAAQWTDERGQRHTKYFNPKYYATESEARHEAFKFKVHIAREIELRGGVQKRRTTPITNGVKIGTAKGTESFLDHPFTRERQKRPTRKATAKARAVRDADRASFELYNSGFFSDTQAWIRTTDFLLLQQQQQQQQQRPRNESNGDYSGLGCGEEFDGSALNNSSCSPLSTTGSPPTTLFYNPQTFDSIFIPSQQFTSQYLPPSAGYPNQSYRLGQAVGSSPALEESSSSSSSSSFPSTALPPGTSFCLCGCGELALAPARYASHHHSADPTENNQTGENSFEASTVNSAFFPISTDFLPDESSQNSQHLSTSESSNYCDDVLGDRKRLQEQPSNSSDTNQDKKRLCRSSEVAHNDESTEYHILDRIKRNCPPNIPTDESPASFPFTESWVKCYSPYASYPTSGEAEATINELLGRMSSSEKFREAMLLLTSSASSTGPPDLNAADQFAPEEHQDQDDRLRQ